MAYYNYKAVLDILPEDFMTDFRAKRLEETGEEYEGTCDYDGDLWLAAASYIEKLRAELAIAREALEWYADSSNYKLRYIPKRAMEMPIVDDEGQRARAALSGAEPKSRGGE